MTPAPRVLVAVALGGALGAALRQGAGEVAPDGTGFPATTFAINVVGSLLLALLPALGVVRRSPTLTAGLGPGLIGGFTTLSAASEQTRSLLAGGSTLLAGGYVVGTLAACLLAVALASRWSRPAAQDELARDGGEE